MAAETFHFNITKGRSIELYNRVKSNDPAASALVLVPFSLGGTEAQGQDIDTLALLEADANFAEITTNGWVRKTLTDTELAAFPAPDDTNNRYAVQNPAVTWTGPTAGGNTAGLGVFYDSDTAAGTDANLLPISFHIFAVTADGNDVVLNVADLLRAS